MKKCLSSASYTLSVLVLTFFSLLLFLGSASAHGDLGKHKKQTMVFIVDNVSAELIARLDLPNIDKLMDGGSYGLMNVRSAGSFTDGSGYLTLGTGTKSAAGGAGGQAYLAGEYLSSKSEPRTAKAVYTERNGSVPPDGSLVHIGFESVKRRSAMVPFNIVPGLLGQAMTDNELSIALVGNADGPASLHRESSLIGVDQSGVIRHAYFTDAIWQDGMLHRSSLSDTAPDAAPNFDPRDLIEFYPQVRNKNLVIVDTGATARVDKSYASTVPSVFERNRIEALQTADLTIGLFVDKIKQLDPKLEDHLIMVVVPNPAKDEAAQKNYLTPVLVAGGGFDRGTLETDSTRRHGVITSMDFAPTVLNYFGIDPPVSMSGRPFRPAEESDPVALVRNIQENAVPMYQTRNTVLGTFTFLNLLVLVILLVYLAIYRRQITPFIRRYPGFIVLLLLIPAGFLFQYPVSAKNVLWAVGLSSALAAAGAAILMMLFRDSMLKAVTAACLLTTAVILGDILMGGKLMLLSYFGSDVIAGGRFYGIGNTYMGILVGAAVVGVSGLWQILRTETNKKFALSVALLLFVALCIGHPRLGANVGGFITGVSALVFFVLLFKFERLKLRHFVGLGFIILGALSALIAVDLFLNPVQSHLARAFVSIQTGGLSEVFEIIGRKVNLNLRFFRSSFLSSFLVIVLMLLIPFLARPFGLLRSVQEDNIPLFKGLTVAAYTALVALVFNDTGIVAAAAASQFIIFPILLLASERILKDGEEISAAGADTGQA